MKPLWLFLLLVPNLFSAQTGTGFLADSALVVSARVEASRIGADILKQGGNAFDAAISVQLALAVAYPYAGNISGGGFLVYRLKDGSVGSLDFRETAPGAAHKDMFLDASGNVVPGLSEHSALAVGVPGSVAGIFAIHRRFGKLPVHLLFQPAIDLARNGVVVTEKQLAQIESYRKEILEINQGNDVYSKTLKVGDTVRNLSLARTLTRISDHGPDEFYQGLTSRYLLEFLKKRGGIMTAVDLKNYQAIWREPVRFSFNDLEIISIGLPSSGGFCLQQIFQMIEPFHPEKMDRSSVRYISLLTEAEKRSFADRNRFLGDPDFIKEDVSQWINKSYLKDRLKPSDLDSIKASSEIFPGNRLPESDETTHFSIVDTEGNAVSVTTTLNGAFGSKLYCEELGFFLNNEMDDFSAKPGSPNMFGLTGSKANAIAPGKRMLSSMSPTIVEENGRLFMVLGSPGGSTIITSVLQNILNVGIFGLGMQQSVAAPRFHHQWLPDEIMVEPGGFSQKVLMELKQKGYKINERLARVIGKVDAILVRPDGSLEAGADPRGDDAAAGF